MLLHIQDVKKEYGTKTVLDIKSFSVYTGDKIGVVGKNASGKSTLLEIIAGRILPDRGHVHTTVKTVYMEQFFSENKKKSGGENQKLQIQNLKGRKNLLVLADEPTSNLDAPGQEWLIRELGQVETFLVVSHDRKLLDSLCTKIIEVKDGRITPYTGNYSAYQQEKEIKEQQTVQEQEAYEKKKRQLEQAVQKKEKQVSRTQKSFQRKTRKNESEARLWRLSQSNLEKQIQQEQSVLRGRLERLEEVSSGKKERKIVIDFSKTDPPRNKRLLVGENYSFGYGAELLFDKACFHLGGNGERLALCGENGSGKTTLIRSILEGHPDITAAPKLRIGYLAQNFSQLEGDKTVLENAASTSVQNETTTYNVLAALLFTGGELEKKASVLSGGEHMRLGLGKLVLSSCNCLVLDEPTNFLDMESLVALEETLLHYPGSVLFVSHDPTFTDKIATRKIVIQDKKLVAPKTKRKKVKVDELLLGFQRDAVVNKLATATGVEKEKLEKEYEEIVEQLG